MFTDYFARKSEELIESVKQNQQGRGVPAPGKEKDLSIYQDFFSFLRDHLPNYYSLATGKVRNKKHLLNRNCDVLIYHKIIPAIVDMTGGYVLSDYLFAFMSLENDLTRGGLVTHANMTNALKSLFEAGSPAGENRIIPMFSILFAFKSTASLTDQRDEIARISEEKGITLNHELDLICVLGQGLIIKDWENQGGYKVIETGPDTLLWFYALLLEYIDRDGNVGIDPREYIKNSTVYKEY